MQGQYKTNVAVICSQIQFMNYQIDVNEQSSLTSYLPTLSIQHFPNFISDINNSIKSLFSQCPLYPQNCTVPQIALQITRHMLSIRHRDKAQKHQMKQTIKKLNFELTQSLTHHNSTTDKLQKQLNKVTEQRDLLNMKLKQIERSFKEQSDKMSVQKQQLSRQLKNAISHQAQFRHENKKQQLTIKSLQQRCTKEKIAYRNSFEVMQQLPSVLVANAQHQYNQIVTRTMQQSYSEVMKQNNTLRQYLQHIESQLMEVVHLKQQLNRDQLSESFHKFKPQTLMLPLAYAPLKEFSENVENFKCVLNQSSSTPIQSIKHLVQAYKGIIQQQDQMLSTVVVKQKDIKHKDGEGCEEQIKKAKKFLHQQQSYLAHKNKELDKIKKNMESTLKKAEDQKNIFSKKTHQMVKEMQMMQKEIQKLPIKIENQ